MKIVVGIVAYIVYFFVAIGLLFALDCAAFMPGMIG